MLMPPCSRFAAMYLLFILLLVSGGCLPHQVSESRPAANLVTVVEAYLQQYQPGPLPRLFQTTYLYDRNGTLLTEVYPEGRRTWVSLASVSPHLLNATIATEDASFYRNPGIDLRRIAGAILQNTQAQDIVSGASTITMQLARNLFLEQAQRYDQSLERKTQEVRIAQELTGLYSKDEILEMYLNLLNYANLTYGPEAAARFYFGKAAADLTLAEASLLAGIPQRPADLNPLTNFAAVKDRQRVVLDLMVRHGYLTASQADTAYAQPLRFQQENGALAPPNRAPHFTQYVLDTLGQHLGQEYVRRAGLRIVTTLDLNLQAVAQQTVSEQVARLQTEFDMSNAALVALQPGTAEVLAMVGSADFNNAAIAGQVNVAVRKRQPGSAIKPLLYATAFADNLISPATVLWDVPATYPQPNGQLYQPQNYDNRFHGPVTVRTALANSYNIPAVRLLNLYGIAPMIERLRQLGLTTLDQESDWYGLSLALGGAEVTLLDLTTAFHTLANAGRYLPAQVVRSIIDGQGQVETPSATAQARQVLTPEAAFLVTDILSDNVARQPIFGANSPLLLSRPAAAKTGTTNDLRDNWTVGYTRYLVAGIWSGNSDNRPMRGATGVSGAAPIWHAFMESVLADPALLALLDAPADPAAWAFTPPPGLQQLAQCPPDLACRPGGEYFTNAWLAKGQADPLYDSVMNAPAAPVLLEQGGERRPVGFCSGLDVAQQAGPRTLLMLPNGFSQDEANALLTEHTAPDAPVGSPDPAQRLQKERAQVLAWSRSAGLPLHLGNCTAMEPVVRALLPPAEQEGGRFFVDSAAAGVVIR